MTGRRFARLALVLAGTCAAAIAARAFVSAEDVPRGLVRGFRLYGFDAPARAFSLSSYGWVDFPAGEGTLHVDVQNAAGDWETDVATTTPAAAARPGTTDQFAWEIVTRIPVRGPELDRWNDGGMLRVRVVARRRSPNGSNVAFELPVEDTNGVRGRIPVVFVADTSPTPIAGDTPPPYLGYRSYGAPYGDVAAADELTRRYYRSVGTAPDGGGATIEQAFPTFGDFNRHYFITPLAMKDGNGDSCIDATPRGGELVAAKFFNVFPLGLGRSVQCSYNRCSDETACWVQEFGGAQREEHFGDFAAAASALRNAPALQIGAAGIVHRGRISRSSPNRLLFVFFRSNPDDLKEGPFAAKLGYHAKFDSRGFVQAVPHTCLGCHGVTARFDPATSAVFDAHMLPFDANSYRFFANGTFHQLGTAQQLASIERLNRLVRRTDVADLPATVELIDGWYGGPPKIAEGVGRFNYGFVPAGWNHDDNERQLYRKVVKFCRGCHASASGAMALDNAAQFEAMKDRIYDLVCRSHLMPHSEQSLDAFWRSDARAHLLNRLGIQSGCEPR